MNKLFMLHFLDSSISSDIINDKGKVTHYKEVFCISDSEGSARALWV